MATPPFSGFVLIGTEKEDGIELEAWAWDAKTCKTAAEVAAQIALGNTAAAVGYQIPPSPIGLREGLKVSGVDRYWNLNSPTRTLAKVNVSALVDLVMTKTTA